MRMRTWDNLLAGQQTLAHQLQALPLAPATATLRGLLKLEYGVREG